MDFADRIKDLGERIAKLHGQVDTEEATKNAFVMPFISALGFDVFNPMELVPEFTADIGTKKGEKVDYCIKVNEEPTIIIETKHWRSELNLHHSQLHRYFHVTPAKFAILTNGIQYCFYTDLEDTNKMDDKPFFEFSIDKISDASIIELKRFHKMQFDASAIRETASDLRYSKEIKELLATELREASEDFVRYIAGKIYSGRVGQKVVDQFSVLINKSSKALISEMINERLQKALDRESEAATNVTETLAAAESGIQSGIVTTESEREGFHIVQAIMRKVLDVDRIFARDVKSYFSVLLDNTNRKPLCRLHFNNEDSKQITLFGVDKEETRIDIETIDDIYKYEDKLLETASWYLQLEQELASE